MSALDRGTVRGLRLTRRGRAVVVILALGALLGSFWLGTWQAGIAATGERAAYDVVTVRPGQTLWEIASRRAPDADPRIMVYRMVRMNEMPSVHVRPGQRVKVPVAR